MSIPPYWVLKIIHASVTSLTSLTCGSRFLDLLTFLLYTTRMNQHKACSYCQYPKPLTAFGRNRQTLDGLNYYCKVCAALKQADWAKANPEKAKASKAKYLQRIRATNMLRDDPYVAAFNDQ